jgi:hypothetical protein
MTVTNRLDRPRVQGRMLPDPPNGWATEWCSCDLVQTLTRPETVQCKNPTASLDRPLCTLKVNLLVFAQLLFWETKTNFKVPQIVTHITFVSVMLA